jgi:DNA adenine methylase
MNSGENGKGVASRWYAKTLAHRIARIHQFRGQIEFADGDGFPLIDKHAADPNAAFFIDPPYTASTKRAGRRLYNHNEIDHDALFDAMAGIRGKFLMTYDDDDRIERMALAREFKIDRVAMKNTHHNRMVELLITSPRNQT